MKKNTAGTDSLFVMTHKEIRNILKDRTVTYEQRVVDYRPQKPDPNRVRITSGGDIIKYLGKLTTRTADLTTSKIIWNIVVSTKYAKYMGIDIKTFTLAPHWIDLSTCASHYPCSQTMWYNNTNCEERKIMDSFTWKLERQYMDSHKREY